MFSHMSICSQEKGIPPGRTWGTPICSLDRTRGTPTPRQTGMQCTWYTHISLDKTRVLPLPPDKAGSSLHLPAPCTGYASSHRRTFLFGGGSFLVKFTLRPFTLSQDVVCIPVKHCAIGIAKSSLSIYGLDGKDCASAKLPSKP